MLHTYYFISFLSLFMSKRSTNFIIHCYVNFFKVFWLFFGFFSSFFKIIFLCFCDFQMFFCRIVCFLLKVIFGYFYYYFFKIIFSTIISSLRTFICFVIIMQLLNFRAYTYTKNTVRRRFYEQYGYK